MSLRLSSLDPNQPRAAKDCRICNRRRIKCDRSLPTCKKCALKNLTCPGYGLRIQWGQGVASRGKLTGKTLPVLEPAPHPANLDRDSPNSATPGESSDSREEAAESSILARGEPVPSPPHALRNAFQPIYDENILRNPYALNLDVSSYVLPNYLQGRPVKQLISYFDHVVSKTMPWVDGNDNAWRTLMIPLAMESPSLLLAILALSAEHYSSMHGATWPPNDGLVSRPYRDQSLQLLAQNLRTEVLEDANVARQTQTSAILATILVLCNLEMIRSDSASWSVHWKAARTITRRWTAPHLSSTNLDDTCRFLLKEAFVYDVFGSSTTFNDDEQILSSVLTETDAHIFTDWLKLVQDVTCAERRRNDHPSSDQPSLELADMHVLQQRFDYARNRSLEFSKTLDFDSPSLRRDFCNVIDILHYAGLVYSFQALLDPHESMSVKETCVSGVIRKIGEIENKHAYQHDLVWPLFIIGTQCRHNKEMQDFAEAQLLQVMKSTGFSNCMPALVFLKRFWSTHPSDAADWMQFARQESKRGLTFLVI